MGMPVHLSDTRQKLLENFDAEVHERLRVNLRESQAYLDTYERWLWEVTRFHLQDNADFSESDYSFMLKKNPFPGEEIPRGPYRIGKDIKDAHIYRPGHPLAQRILEYVKCKDLPQAEVTFDYSGNPEIVSVLRPLIGKSGVIKVTSMSIKALESEDYTLVSAIDDEGKLIESEIVKKLFRLGVRDIMKADVKDESTIGKLHQAEENQKQDILSKISERNSGHFDTEVEKLDKWAEDMKKAIELDLRKLEIDIKAEKTSARKIVNLEEKLKIQREIKEMEKKRNEMRRRLFDAQDEVDQRKETLIEHVESMLKQSVTLKELFTIRWKVC